MTTSRPRRLPASLPTTLVLAAAAGALVLTASGGAVAGAMITGAQIKDNSVTGKDVRNRSLTAQDLNGKTVASFSKPGPQGADGPRGMARAWGRVAVTGAVSQSSPGLTAVQPEDRPGVFCVTAPGVDPATSVAIVTPDFYWNGTSVGTNNTQSFVEAGNTLAPCPDDAFAVSTFLRSYASADGKVASTTLTRTNQPFFVLIP